jgi:hypothetical protein
VSAGKSWRQNAETKALVCFSSVTCQPFVIETLSISKFHNLCS